MASIQKTFTIPEEIVHQLDSLIKNQERSKFVTQTLAEALQKKSRQKLIDAIDNATTWETSDQSVVDTIRQIRGAHFDRLSDQ